MVGTNVPNEARRSLQRDREAALLERFVGG
jgi:hypothetical protein